MTSDDEFFFDYLAWIPNDVKRYSQQVTEAIDKHVNQAAGYVRDTAAQQQWIPSSIRPSPRARFPTPGSSTGPSTSIVGRTQDWMLRNRAWSAAIIAFVGTGCLLLYSSRKLRVKKRKARKAANGARREIIVIAGSPHEPITRSVANDLERRGFIVFITVTSTEEEQAVQSEGREDLRPLWLDLANTPSIPSEVHPSLYVIQSLITHPQIPSPGMQPHTCQLSGIIVIPSPNCPTGPISTIPASSWADTINTRLLYPILATQLFLPLLNIKHNNSSIVFLSPSIQSAVFSPFAGPEVTTARGLSGFAASLRQELRLLEPSLGSGRVDVVELKLGNLDFGRQYQSRGVGGGGGRSANKGTEVLT